MPLRFRCAHMQNFILLALFIYFSIPTEVRAEFKMLDVDTEINFNKSWYDKESPDEESFKKLVNFLKTIPTGKKIIQNATLKAAEKGQTLYDVLDIGEGSITDTTLIRRFRAADPSIVAYETKSKVYLNRHLKTLDALLDLAHELTHFTYREAFNPYGLHFTLKDFIKGTVEGRGGEVEAYLMECKVLSELSRTKNTGKSYCNRIIDPETKTVSFELGVKEFYKLGAFYALFKKDLDKYSLTEKDLPKASKEESLFISSAWGLPYPLAAVKEYANIMSKVCKNDLNRLSIIQNKTGKTADSSAMFEDYTLRCEKFSQI